jgi:dihydrofolate reductase
VAATQYFAATSLDGYIADENDSVEWLFEVDRGESIEASSRSQRSSRTSARWRWARRRTSGCSTTSGYEPDKWRGWYGDTPCWVFTHRTLPAVPGANIVLVHGDVAPVHEQMADAFGGKNVWLVGGGDLVGQFADRQLLEEIIVGVAPVTSGAALLSCLGGSRRRGSSSRRLPRPAVRTPQVPRAARRRMKNIRFSFESARSAWIRLRSANPR